MNEHNKVTKTLQDFKDELCQAYGRKDYKLDFDIGAGLSKLMSEEEFFTKAAERYAAYREHLAKEKAWDEGLNVGWHARRSSDIIPNPYKQKEEQ